jgi:oligopeptide/dipeptide ABC transporter ATP-binding protein
MDNILEISNLHVEISGLPVIRGIDLSIKRGKTLALVGESGCGKTMTAMSILQLLTPAAKIKSGKILFENKNLLNLSENEMQKVRGKDISLVFQEPGLALNPVYAIGNQIGEAITLHRPDIKDIRKETIRLLNLVKIPDPENKIRAYPHQLSGGMQQRALIAMAIACNPKLLIADEPTTALDVTVQAQILLLTKELISKLNMSVLIITHDLGIVAEVADFVAVMYAGRIVEYTDVFTLFKNPAHPYTKGLLESIPLIEKKQKKLQAIPGNVPDITHIPKGCTFNPRCAITKEQCKIKTPKPREISTGHWIECDIMDP